MHKPQPTCHPQLALRQKPEHNTVGNVSLLQGPGDGEATRVQFCFVFVKLPPQEEVFAALGLSVQNALAGSPSLRAAGNKRLLIVRGARPVTMTPMGPVQDTKRASGAMEGHIPTVVGMHVPSW